MLRFLSSLMRPPVVRSSLPLLMAVAALLLGVQGNAQTVRVLGSTQDAPLYGAMQATDGNYYSSSTYPLTYSCADNANNDCSGISRITPAGVVTTFHNFEVNPTTGTNVDGQLPNPIIEAPDGNFYGTARIGGAGNEGTFFRITPTGTFTLLYTFNVDPASGSSPGPVILGRDGYFYGVTEFGGVNAVKQPGGGTTQDAQGTLFKISKDGTFTVLHTFSMAEGVINAIANFPPAIVQGIDGSFYGAGLALYNANQSGNDQAPALLYKVDENGNLTIIHTFATDGSEGSGVYGPLVAGPDGNFYGAALSSAPVTGNGVFANRLDTVFSTNPSGGFQKIYTFLNTAVGNDLDQNLTLGSDGNFYGTAKFGGSSSACTQSSGCGTVFQLTPSGGFTVEHNFTGGTADSGFPEGPLVQTNDGSFIGSAYTTTAYDLALVPALHAPIQVTLDPANVAPNKPVQLTWKVLNAFSATMQQCHAMVLNASTGGAAGAGSWFGPQTGSMVGGVYTGTATITPTMNGTYTYELNCGGVETGSATLTVGSGLTIVNTSLPGATVSKTYSVTLEAINGTEPYNWTAGSELPAGLTLSNTGVLSGTPKQFGSFQVIVGVYDSSTPQGLAAATLPLTIVSGLTISPSLANPTLNEKYSGALKASGGYGSYKWSVSAGKLPAGFTLNATTGVITGTATAVTTSTFTIMITDGESPAAKVTQAFSITTQVEPLQVTEGKFPDCFVGKECEGQFTATGGVGPYTWAIAKGTTFPAGLTLDEDGAMSGTPTQYQGSAYILAVTVTDSSSPPLQQNGSVTVDVSSGLLITAIPLPTATVGQAYAAPPPTATGGLPPYTWTIYPPDPNLKSEYYADKTTGALMSSGPLTPGTFEFQYQISDSEKNPAIFTANASLTVVLPNQPTTTTLMSSSNVAGTGEPITLTAKVTASSGIPSGLVTFYSGAISLGTANLDKTGSAALSTSFSTVGTYSLTAGYSGSGAVTGSVSAPLTETIITPTVSGAVTPGTLTLTAGQTGTLLLTLTPKGDYAGTVTFSCGQLPAHVSCTFAPKSLTIAAGSGPVTDTLTIDTGAKTSAMLHKPMASQRWETTVALTLWLPASLLGFFGVRRKRRRLPRLLAACVLACCLGMLSGLTGCGSAPSTAKAGTYSIPITLTLTGGMTQSITATVVVQ